MVLGEFFINPLSENRIKIGEKLLQHFSQNSSFPIGHKLRFDISINDQVMNNLLIEKGYSHKKQTFNFFEMPTNDFNDKDFKRALIDNINVNQVAEVLLNLVSVDSDEVSGWLNNDQIRCIATDGEIIVAAQISNGEESV